ISPQRLNVAGLEGDVGEPVFGGALEFREHLDVLVVVHLEIGEHQAAARLVHREGLLKSQGAAVKISRRGQVVRSEADVSNADDGRGRPGAGKSGGRGWGGLGFAWRVPRSSARLKAGAGHGKTTK